MEAGRTRTDRIVVKFRDDAGVELEAGVPFGSSIEEGSAPFHSVLAHHPNFVCAPHFLQGSASLRATRLAGERRCRRPLPRLDLYTRLSVPPGTPVSAVNALMVELARLDIVETVFAEPLPEAAAILEGSTEDGAGTGPPAGTSPDFRPLQLYLREAPVGLAAQAVREYPGGRGSGVRLIDIEGGWNWSHEDLIRPFFESGPALEGWQNHGTAVLGELIGADNGRGIEGMVPDLEVGAISFGDLGVAAAIELAASKIGEGDIILIEVHAPGPNAPHGPGQFGYVPMEYWQDVFDAIQVATANGRIVVEAGGNGQQNLDDPVYAGLFDRERRDSGAILVGAGTPLGLTAEWFTNYGSRVDLHAWGTSITTTGYGTLQGGPENRWYTTGFGGTSGASPLVSGAIASLQGMSRATFGVSLDRDLVVEILTRTGTPAHGGKAIGPRPDLAAARALLIEGVGRVHGLVRDRVTSEPLAQVRIEFGDARTAWTDEQGYYHLAVFPGLHSLRAGSFWHETSTRALDVRRGAYRTQDFWLQPRAHARVDGIVTWHAQPATSVPVVFLESPLVATTDTSGEFSVAQVPHGEYLACAGPITGTGASWKQVLVAGGEAHVSLELPEAETFESTNGGFVAEPGWDLGTPGLGPIPHSGVLLWGTSLSGDYGNRTHTTLTSGPLLASGAQFVHLSFSHWYRMETAWDGGRVEVWTGSSWQTVEPIGGYPMSALSGLNWGPGYSGVSAGWEAALFDLTDWAHEDLRIRFVFGSDESVTDLGWYLDDVAIHIERTPVAAPEPPHPAATGPTLSPPSPSPFSEQTRLSFRLTAAGQAHLVLCDAAGRRVRELIGAPLGVGLHQMNWDGRDDHGRPCPDGVYYCRMSVDGIPVAAQSMLRIR